MSKLTDVFIDGTKYHAVGIIRKPDNELIIRLSATSGQDVRCDFQKIHSIRFEKDNEAFSYDVLLKSSGNNTKVTEFEFRIVNLRYKKHPPKRTFGGYFFVRISL